MIIPIASDHAGYSLKLKVINFLKSKGFEVKDYGPFNEESVDYPDYGHLVAQHVSENENNLGVVICGSGNGINMTVNKYQKIRSALCWTKEITKLAREHNDANIIALPARFVSDELALDMIDIFFSTEFEGGRHQRRVDKIKCS
jgi:ribose 5-phosphate isomerase B